MPLALLMVAVLAVIGLFLLPTGVLVVGVTLGLIFRYGLIVLAVIAWVVGWGFLAQRGLRSELVGVGAFGVPFLLFVWWLYQISRV